VSVPSAARLPGADPGISPRGLGLYLSTSTSPRVFMKGRAVAPGEEQLGASSTTPIRPMPRRRRGRKGEIVWLWVMTPRRSVCIWSGRGGGRLSSKCLAKRPRLVDDGWLPVYRKYKNRVRCWAHLLRKARGWPKA
jgi:hypothetical protein